MKNRNNYNTGLKINNFLKSNGIKQKYLAEEIGRSEAAVSLMLNGKVVITADDLISMAIALRTTPDILTDFERLVQDDGL